LTRLTKKEYAIIVAGGKGTRLKSETPKQFLELCGKPILVHTIEAFYNYSSDVVVILVLPQTCFELWDSIAKKYHLNERIILQAGGETRFQSVKNGLAKIEGEGLVAIHDGVRPLVSKDIIAESFRMAAIQGSAVAAVPLKDSIRIAEQEMTKAMNRSKFRLIQTPQTFDVHLIRSAYRLKEDETLTDDASVAERTGHTISLFEGSYENIKITTPEDLVVAEALLKMRL
jgi:2-C-methyl-D-erythritol 4-phosphate cytidylyltransferase